MSAERPERRTRSSRPDGHSSSSRSSRDPSKQTRESAKKVGQVASEVKDTAKNVAQTVGDAVGGAAEALGGWRELDKYIKEYNPTFCDFVNQSFLKRIGATSKPSKFLVLLVGLGILQSTLPLFAWPLDFCARLLSFVFLYNTGLDELKSGFGSRSETRAMKVKSFLTTYLLVALLEIVPMFLFDTTYHFGALWSFLFPMILFVTPDSRNPKETIAIWIADSIFAQVSSVLDSVVPDSFLGGDQTTAFLSAGVIALLLWAGMLGSTGSYLMVFVVLGFATTHHVGKEYVSPSTSSSGFVSQMTIWHNLLAIWLWRCLVSAIESLQIPGVISVVGWIQYHLPSYFLWMTGFFFAMLLTKKTASSSGRANTWYAKWLTGKFGSAVASKSSSEANPSARPSSSSSSRRSGESSSRSGSGKGGDPRSSRSSRH